MSWFIEHIFDLDSLVEMAMVEIFLATTFPCRRNTRWTIVESAAILLLFAVCNSFLIYMNEIGAVNAGFRFYGYLALVCLFAVVFAVRTLTGDRRQFIATALYFSSNAVLVTGLVRIAETQAKPSLGDSILTCVLLLLVVLGYRCITKPVKVRISSFYWGLMLLVPLFILGLRQLSYGKTESVELIFCSVVMILLTFITYFLFMRLIAEMEGQMELKLNNQSMDLQIRQMDHVENMLESIRKARHELKNNYFLLESLLKQKKYEELEMQLREVVQVQLDGQEMVSTGNRFIDLLLSQKIGEAKQWQIPIVLDVLLPSEIAIQQQMLCSLLFNLLDNAIEASMQVEEPDIFFSMHEKKGYLYIEVRNKIEGSVLKQNPRLHTSKQDASHHGIGMSLIRQIVQHCDGQMKIWEEDSMFIVSILLPDRKATPEQ